jgi:hypothetical protein
MDHYFFTAENPAEGAAFTYHLAQPAQKVRLLVTTPAGKLLREVAGPGSAGVVQRVTWDLRLPLSATAGRASGGGGGGEEGGGSGGPGSQKPGVIQLPVPSHDIALRGPLVAPGTFKVTLEVDGVAAESRAFEVRADPTSRQTLAEHKAREAFVVEVMALQARVDSLAPMLTARRTAAMGDEATRLQALEQQLVGGRGAARPGAAGAAGAGAPAAGGGGRGGAQGIRQRLGSLAGVYTSSGARTGTLSAPTGAMRASLTEIKADLLKIEKALNSGTPTKPAR